MDLGRCCCFLLKDSYSAPSSFRWNNSPVRPVSFLRRLRKLGVANSLRPAHTSCRFKVCELSTAIQEKRSRFWEEKKVTHREPDLSDSPFPGLSTYASNPFLGARDSPILPQNKQHPSSCSPVSAQGASRQFILSEALASPLEEGILLSSTPFNMVVGVLEPEQLGKKRKASNSERNKLNHLFCNDGLLHIKKTLQTLPMTIKYNKFSKVAECKIDIRKSVFLCTKNELLKSESKNTIQK